MSYGRNYGQTAESDSFYGSANQPPRWSNQSHSYPSQAPPFRHQSPQSFQNPQHLPPQQQQQPSNKPPPDANRQIPPKDGYDDGYGAGYGADDSANQPWNQNNPSYDAPPPTPNPQQQSSMHGFEGGFKRGVPKPEDRRPPADKQGFNIARVQDQNNEVKMEDVYNDSQTQYADLYQQNPNAATPTVGKLPPPSQQPLVKPGDASQLLNAAASLGMINQPNLFPINNRNQPGVNKNVGGQFLPPPRGPLGSAPDQRGISDISFGDYSQHSKVDPNRTTLDFFNSDLSLIISPDGYSAEALTKPMGFCLCWSGARATHGVMHGKVCFEVIITENLPVDFGEDHNETNAHVIRVGWSQDSHSLQLGEDPGSFGYGGTAKKSANRRFADYGDVFGLGDVITSLLDFTSSPPTISFCKNGVFLGLAFTYTEKKPLFPHILSKNCRFEVNFGQRPAQCMPPHGYKFIDDFPFMEKIPALQPPKTKSECEIIMVVGLPGAGKTTWALNLQREKPAKRYNIIGTDSLIDKMRVMGLPRKNNYHGRWDVLIKRATECLNKLFTLGSQCNRNYILDQTNVYPSARRRKMKFFVGFKRVCAVLITNDVELKRRSEKRTYEDGKFVPEEAVNEMKLNFTLPSVQEDHIDDIVWIELPEQDSLHLVHQYNQEGKQQHRRSASAPNTSFQTQMQTPPPGALGSQFSNSTQPNQSFASFGAKHSSRESSHLGQPPVKRLKPEDNFQPVGSKSASESEYFDAARQDPSRWPPMLNQPGDSNKFHYDHTQKPSEPWQQKDKHLNSSRFDPNVTDHKHIQNNPPPGNWGHDSMLFPEKQSRFTDQDRNFSNEQNSMSKSNLYAPSANEGPRFQQKPDWHRDEQSTSFPQEQNFSEFNRGTASFENQNRPPGDGNPRFPASNQFKPKNENVNQNFDSFNNPEPRRYDNQPSKFNKFENERQFSNFPPHQREIGENQSIEKQPWSSNKNQTTKPNITTDNFKNIPRPDINQPFDNFRGYTQDEFQQPSYIENEVFDRNKGDYTKDLGFSNQGLPNIKPPTRPRVSRFDQPQDLPQEPFADQISLRQSDTNLQHNLDNQSELSKPNRNFSRFDGGFNTFSGENNNRVEPPKQVNPPGSFRTATGGAFPKPPPDFSNTNQFEDSTAQKTNYSDERFAQRFSSDGDFNRRGPGRFEKDNQRTDFNDRRFPGRSRSSNLNMHEVSKNDRSDNRVRNRSRSPIRERSSSNRTRDHGRSSRSDNSRVSSRNRRDRSTSRDRRLNRVKGRDNRDRNSSDSSKRSADRSTSRSDNRASSRKTEKASSPKNTDKTRDNEKNSQNNKHEITKKETSDEPQVNVLKNEERSTSGDTKTSSSDKANTSSTTKKVFPKANLAPGGFRIKVGQQAATPAPTVRESLWKTDKAKNETAKTKINDKDQKDSSSPEKSKAPTGSQPKAIIKGVSDKSTLRNQDGHAKAQDSQKQEDILKKEEKKVIPRIEAPKQNDTVKNDISALQNDTNIQRPKHLINPRGGFVRGGGERGSFRGFRGGPRGGGRGGNGNSPNLEPVNMESISITFTTGEQEAETERLVSPNGTDGTFRGRGGQNRGSFRGMEDRGGFRGRGGSFPRGRGEFAGRGRGESAPRGRPGILGMGRGEGVSRGRGESFGPGRAENIGRDTGENFSQGRGEEIGGFRHSRGEDFGGFRGRREERGGFRGSNSRGSFRGAHRGNFNQSDQFEGPFHSDSFDRRGRGASNRFHSRGRGRAF